MVIQDRNLTAGTKLWAKYKGEIKQAEVVETEGTLRYRLADGREFKSPSAAGNAMTGKSCNGWAFWTVGEPTEKASTERSSRTSGSSGTVNAVPKPEKKGRARRERTAARDGNGRVLPIVEQVDGSFECGNCGASFPTNVEAKAHITEAHPA